MKKLYVVPLITLAMSACAAGRATSPVVTPPAPHLSSLFVSAFNGDPAGDHKVEGAHVLFDAQSADTDGAGNVSFDQQPDGVHHVTVQADGFNPVITDVTLPHSDPLNVALTRTLASSGQSGFLHTCSVRPSGPDLCDDSGQPWLFAGYDTYTLLANAAHGHDITPVLDEAAGYGYNVAVVLGMDLGPWSKDHSYDLDPRDPRWPGLVAQLFDDAAQRQMRVFFAVFQQAQPLSDAEQKAVWQRACDVARGRWNVILALGNEDDVNGWRHENFPRCNGDMGGVLLSTGSRGINNPPTPPNWDIALWEPRRGPLHKAMDDAGAGVLEQHAGYPGFPAVTVPVVEIEPPFFNNVTPDQFGDQRWTDPKLALQLGLEIGSNSAGGSYGDSYSLIGEPSRCQECARQFIRGLRAAFQR